MRKEDALETLFVLNAETISSSFAGTAPPNNTIAQIMIPIFLDILLIICYICGSQLICL